MNLTASVLVMALAGVAASSAEPVRFDLACLSVQEGAAAGRRVSSRIHVDLGTRRWCVDSCRGGMLPIARISDEQLVFAEERNASNTTNIRYDRRSGAYQHEVKVGEVLTMSMSGRCDVVPASEPGSPQRRS